MWLTPLPDPPPQGGREKKAPMTFPDITPDLKAAMPELRGRLLGNEPLAPLTWFRVGGPAQVLFTPADEDDLAYFLANLPGELPVYVVGVGSNLIVRDGGMPGVVIRLGPRGFGATDAPRATASSAGAAALDKRVAETAAAANIGGLEFYFGIPGSIGGALRMNAGANGGETKDVLVEATGIGRDGTQASFRQRRHAVRLPQQRRRSVDHLHLGAVSRAHHRSVGDSRAHGGGAEPSRDRAADPRKDRRLDLQESAGRRAPGSWSTRRAAGACASAAPRCRKCTAIF